MERIEGRFRFPDKREFAYACPECGDVMANSDQSTQCLNQSCTMLKIEYTLPTIELVSVNA